MRNDLDEELALTEDQRVELQRRVRELDEHLERAIPWDEAREKLRARRPRE